MSNKKQAKQVELFYAPKRLNGDLAVYQYGHHKCPKGHFYGPSVREYYLFHFVVNGKGVYKCGKKEFHIGKGMGFLIKPGEETFYLADENDPWEYYFVAFHGTIAQKIVKEIVWADDYIFCAVNEDAIKHSMKSLCNEKESSVWNEYKALGKLYFLIAELIRQRGLEIETCENEKNEFVLERAVVYINENAMSPDCCVADIARYINMDRTNLYRKFKERFGISVMKYLQNYRMNQAADLLQSTDLLAKDIASKVGMLNYPNFCKSFRVHNGYPPLEYRNKFRTKQTKNKR